MVLGLSDFSYFWSVDQALPPVSALSPRTRHTTTKILTDGFGCHPLKYYNLPWSTCSIIIIFHIFVICIIGQNWRVGVRAWCIIHEFARNDHSSTTKTPRCHMNANRPNRANLHNRSIAITVGFQVFGVDGHSQVNQFHFRGVLGLMIKFEYFLGTSLGVLKSTPE